MSPQPADLNTDGPRLEAGPRTVHWGYFDATLKPIREIASGERITISTVSGRRDVIPPASFRIPAPLQDVLDNVEQPCPGHICTGPLAVRGAKPGQVLEVQIEAIALHYDWGYTAVRPKAGALFDVVEEERLFFSRLNASRGVATLPWGQEVALRPFFGVMATAPPPSWGRVSTLPPRTNGGNLDNKELVAGSTLYLPIHCEGALFSVGDGHGVQGDGEVCVTAIETGLIGTFTLRVRDDLDLTWPQAETPTHVITMAFDEDLDHAVELALAQMLDLLEARTGLDRAQAYALCSLVADVRVTQVVNGAKGIHVMLAKHDLEACPAR
ncbi:MAG: acetamidase/formamidase family protein [Pseudomonadota bacterium]